MRRAASLTSSLFPPFYLRHPPISLRSWHLPARSGLALTVIACLTFAAKLLDLNVVGAINQVREGS